MAITSRVPDLILIEFGLTLTLNFQGQLLNFPYLIFPKLNSAWQGL